MDTSRLIEQAKEYLAKGDGFYHQAAEKIKEAIDNGATQREVGEALGRSNQWVSTLVAWHTSSHSTGTPFARDTKPGNDRHQVKHSLSKMSPEERGQVIAEAVADSPEVAEAVAKNTVAAARISVARATTRERAETTSRARDFREQRGDPGQAAIRFSALISELRTATRLLVVGYQDIMAANPDNDELRELLDERTVTVKGDIIIALDTLVGAGVDAALAEMLKAEEV